VRAALRSGEVVALLPEGTQLVGLAIDVGTTKVAGYLLDLETGRTLAKAGTMNPQISYGEDVISRIAYTDAHADGRSWSAPVFCTRFYGRPTAAAGERAHSAAGVHRGDRGQPGTVTTGHCLALLPVA
jgi:hypothetical protein